MSRLVPPDLFSWPTWAITQPDHPALIWQPAGGPLQTLTWRQLVVATERLAQRLGDAGWRPGERLLHTAGNSAEGVIVALASAAIGTVEVPLAADAAPSWVADIAAGVSGRVQSDLSEMSGLAPFCQSSPTAAASADAAASLTGRLQQHSGDDASLILLTSGSSGRPKAVVLSRRALSVNAAAKLAAVPQCGDDVRLTLLPISHAYARTSDLGTWLISGCTLAIGLGWQGWTALASRVRPTLVNAVPSLITRLAQQTVDAPAMSRLRLLGCGGAALGGDWFERFRSRGITIIQGYGLTEAGPVICSATPDNARPGLVGAPVAGWQTRLADDGRLWVKGDAMMLGYWRDPRATAERIVDGWLDTGDMVEVDPQDGQFRILGRADDRLILDNGMKLYPAPIEQRIQRLPGIRHAILVANGRHVDLWLDADPDVNPFDGAIGASHQTIPSENPFDGAIGASHQTAPRANQFDGAIGAWHRLADGDSAEDAWHRLAIAQLSDLPAWQWPRRTFLMPPLSQFEGLLTAKGTPVRPRVLAMIQAWS